MTVNSNAPAARRGVALSLLVCSTHTRYRTFGLAIQDQLWGQWDELDEDQRGRVEIMILTDNKMIMLGQKRNVMVDAAQGDYVMFVDDDDRVEPDLIVSLLDAIDTHPGVDVVAFEASVTINGGDPRICRYSKDYRRDVNTPTEYHRLPNHICCVRRELARQVSFPSKIRNEDSGYSALLRPLIKTEHQIGRVLYHYDYSDETTETQVERPSAIRSRPVPPVVDVVILSDGATPSLRKLTQQTIDSCLAGANSLPVNVIVAEGQAKARYLRATVVPQPGGGFNYNRTANAAAAHGSAPWILVANNDLRFEDGWLHALLAADYPIVSPHNPGDPRQAGLAGNETGTENGRHLSGWCYMIRRDLHRLIAGFDERVSFWCSDDAVLEQVVAAGYPPMIVPDARVRHLTSRTLARAGRAREELTWGQVRIFNRLYGRDKFSGDARFARWCAAHPETAEVGA